MPRVLIVTGGTQLSRYMLRHVEHLRANGCEVQIQEDAPPSGDRRPNKVWLDEMAALSRVVATRLGAADGTEEGRAQARSEWLRSLRRKKGGY